MKYALVALTTPSAEPVTVAQLKAHLRIRHNYEDENLASFISTALEFVELRSTRQFITRQFRLVLPAFPVTSDAPYGRILLPKPPLQSIQSVKYLDADAVLTTLSTSDYQYSTAEEPGILCPARYDVWPDCDPASLDAVRVEFTAGYGDALTSVPFRARQAIKMLAGHYYENREAGIEKANEEIPYGLASLIRSLHPGRYV